MCKLEQEAEEDMIEQEFAHLAPSKMEALRALFSVRDLQTRNSVVSLRSTISRQISHFPSPSSSHPLSVRVRHRRQMRTTATRLDHRSSSTFWQTTI
jgi:hypothetical protein